MITLPLTQGYVAIVDDADADLAALKWSVLKRCGHVYAHHKDKNNKAITLHQMIAPRVGLSGAITFLNGDGLDCRRENLAHFPPDIRTFRHKRGDSSTGVTGVYYCKQTDMYRVRIARGSKRHDYGRYPTLQEAIEVRKEAEREIYGDVES